MGRILAIWMGGWVLGFLAFSHLASATNVIPLKPGEKWSIEGTDVGKEIHCTAGPGGGGRGDGGEAPRPGRGLKPGLHFKRVENDGFVTLGKPSYVRGEEELPLACVPATLQGICRKGRKKQELDHRCRAFSQSEEQVAILDDRGEFDEVRELSSSLVLRAVGAVESVDCR